MRTNGMIDTRDTALNQRPETFDAIGVGIVQDTDFGVMVDPLMLVTELSHSIIGGEFIEEILAKSDIHIG